MICQVPPTSAIWLGLESNCWDLQKEHLIHFPCDSAPLHFLSRLIHLDLFIFDLFGSCIAISILLYSHCQSSGNHYSTFDFYLGRLYLIGRIEINPLKISAKCSENFLFYFVAFCEDFPPFFRPCCLIDI